MFGSPSKGDKAHAHTHTHRDVVVVEGENMMNYFSENASSKLREGPRQGGGEKDTTNHRDSGENKTGC